MATTNARLLSLSRTVDATSLEAASTRIDGALASGAPGDTLTRIAIGAYRESHYVWQKDGAQ